MSSSDTATELLDAAQEMVQTRGFNAFSYKDLAESIGIRTASIHYHFKTKADLGKALMARYLEELETTLGKLARKNRSRSRLKAFIEMHKETGRRGQICLCGSMVSDVLTLREDVREVVDAYLARCEDWVRSEIERGAKDGEFSPIASSSDLAALLVAGLQGALLLDRPRSGGSMLDRLQRCFWKSLGT